MFKAPWGRQIKIATLVVAGLLVILAALPWVLAGGAYIPRAVGGLLTLGILAGSAMSGVRGYVVLPDCIEIRRFAWTTRLSRRDLQAVEVAPDIMQGSLRVFGIGGLFGLIGRFRNARLGAYRAFVTDPTLTVVLHFRDRRVVVSPDRPVEFAQAVGAPLVSTAPAISAADNSASGLKWVALIPILGAATGAVLIYSASRPVDVQLNNDRLHVRGAFYEANVPRSSIHSIDLLDSRPPIGRRTNGFAFGSKLRGHFDVAGLGQTRVFVDAATGPYLLLQTDDGPLILSLRDASRTRALAELLRLQSQ